MIWRDKERDGRVSSGGRERERDRVRETETEEERPSNREKERYIRASAMPVSGKDLHLNLNRLWANLGTCTEQCDVG